MEREKEPGPAHGPRGSLDRYSRQILFEQIGSEGQRRLAEARVVLVGCGALGSALANTLVRAGVGYLRICDRDYIECDNLQRQVLFDEADIAANLPKAEAAARKLALINSEVRIEPMVTDVNPGNVERLTEGTVLMLDGTDNFETRYLINDLAVKAHRPWVYGAVIGATGLCMTIVPGETPCLRCVFETPPPAEANPTCDTAGVIGPAVQMVAGLQAVEAIKLLTTGTREINRHLVSVDAWGARLVNLNVGGTFERGDCPCCKRGEYSYLEGRMTGTSSGLCGRNAVQVNPPPAANVDFAAIARKIAPVAQGSAKFNEFMLKARLEGLELTLFPDGRAIVTGTDSPDRARSVYAKYVGA